MSIESIIGIISGVITIGLFVPVIYNYFKKLYPRVCIEQ